MVTIFKANKTMKHTARLSTDNFHLPCINVPNAGLYPLLLLEKLSEDETFNEVLGIKQTIIKQMKYTQVIFHIHTPKTFLESVLFYLNNNA